MDEIKTHHKPEETTLVIPNTETLAILDPKLLFHQNEENSIVSEDDQDTIITNYDNQNKKPKTCPICFCDYESNSEIQKFVCGCHTCNDCLKMYIKTAILDGKSQIYCPIKSSNEKLKCNWKFGPDLIIKILGQTVEDNSDSSIGKLEAQKLIKTYQSNELNRALSTLKNIVHCPYTNCTNSFIVPKEMKKCPKVHCDMCDNEFCSTCKSPWDDGRHEGMFSFLENNRECQYFKIDDDFAMEITASPTKKPKKEKKNTKEVTFDTATTDLTPNKQEIPTIHRSLSRTTTSLTRSMSKSTKSKKPNQVSIKCCPQCKAPVMKDGEDCNKIHCSNCETNFCWLCGRKIDSEMHFMTSRCRMYKEVRVNYNQYICMYLYLIFSTPLLVVLGIVLMILVFPFWATYKLMKKHVLEKKNSGSKGTILKNTVISFLYYFSCLIGTLIGLAFAIPIILLLIYILIPIYLCYNYRKEQRMGQEEEDDDDEKSVISETLIMNRIEEVV